MTAGRVVVLGATGFTGELTARALVARGLWPVLAGRDPARLAALTADLGGLPTAVADVRRPGSLTGLVGRGDVLITTVGPFSRLGRPAVEAAVAAGAHYLDPAGEGAFVRTVCEQAGPRAAAAGSVLLPAVGFESVPGNLAAALALAQAGPRATAVEVLYVCDPGVSSGGTRASVAEVLLEQGFARRGGRLVDEPVAARSLRVAVGGRREHGVSIPSSEHLVLHRSYPALRDVSVHLGGFGVAVHAVRAAARLGVALHRFPAARRAVLSGAARLFPGSTGGPGAPRRDRTTTHVWARAADSAGTALAEVHLTGGDPYRLTAELLAWAAERLAAGRVTGTGALGPVEAFGLDDLRAAAAGAGLRDVRTPIPARAGGEL